MDRIAHPSRDLLELCGAACLVALAAAVVLVLRIGPVVLVLGHGRGVHSGDALALPLVATALVLIAQGSGRRRAARYWAPAHV